MWKPRQVSGLVIMTLLLLSVITLGVAAQDENETTTNDEDIACEVDVIEVMNEVQQECSGIGRDQVCYGNVEVNAIPRESRIDLNFESPGDSTDVSLIRSLYLSAMDTVNETWGIAQMRLLANLTQTVPEEVTLLLFGDVAVEDRTTPRVEIDVGVGSEYAARIRNVPSLNSLVIDVAEANEVVRAVGRLKDNSWIRIQEDQYGRVGWVSAQLLQLDGIDVESLQVDNADSPYFGAMQALYFESGSSGACGNSVADGLLIQTPAGVARLTLLINEVSIELLGSDGGATVLLDANPETGMNVNVLDGSANVTVDGTTVFVDSNTSVNISLDEDMNPTGEVSEGTEIDDSVVAGIILLPLIDEIVDTLFPDTGTITDAGTEDEGEGNRNGRSGEQGNRNGNEGNSNRNGNANGGN